MIIDDYVGKTTTTACCGIKYKGLENTVKLLRCEEAHLVNKCSEY